MPCLYACSRPLASASGVFADGLLFNNKGALIRQKRLYIKQKLIEGMQVKLKGLASAAIFLTLACCNNEKTDSASEAIDFAEALSNSKEIPLSKIAKTIQYIPLQTCDSCMLGSIKKIQFAEALIFISDRDQLLTFDSEGRFLSKIGRKGRGPGEYIEVDDFDASLNKRILIYDASQKKVIKYAFDGQFDGEFPIDLFPSKIAVVNDETIIASWAFPSFSWNHENRFTFFSLAGSPVESYRAEAEELLIRDEILRKAVISSSFFNLCNDSLTYFEQGLNKIFYISERGDVKTRYNLINQSKEGDHLNVLNYIGTDNYVFFPNCLYQGGLIRVAFDKRTKEVFSFTSGFEDPRIGVKAGFINDIDGGYPFKPEGVTRDGRVFCSFDMYDLKFLHERDVIKLNSPVNPDQVVGQIDINYLYSNVSDSDNPIIMLVSLK